MSEEMREEMEQNTETGTEDIYQVYMEELAVIPPCTCLLYTSPSPRDA